MHSGSLQGLKQQFSKMADAGNIDVPESSFARKLWKFWKIWPKWFKIGLFLKQKIKMFKFPDI